MRARNRLVGRLQVDQEPSLLSQVQRVPKADGGVARQRRCGLLQRTFAAIVGQGGESLLDCSRRPSRRHLDRHGGDPQAARAELLVFQAEIRQVGTMVGGGSDEPRLDIDCLRHQEWLGHAAAGAQSLEEPVVQHPLVGGVLVDEDDTIWTLGHQVSRTHLADRPEHDIGGSRSDFGDRHCSLCRMQG